MKILMTIFHILIDGITTIYSIDKIMNEKTNFKPKKNIFLIILLGIICYFNWNYNNSYIAIVFSFTIIGFFNFLIRSNKKLDEIVTSTFLYFMVNFLAELCASFALSLFISNDLVLKMMGIEIYANMISAGILLMTAILSNIKLFNKLYNKFLQIVSKTKISTIVVMLFLFIAILNLLYMSIYFDDNLLIKIIANTMLIFVYLFLLVRMLKTRIKYKEVSNKYTNTINALTEYEKMIDFYKVNNHENKNNYLTIRNMLGDSDTKIKDFIDNIIDNRIMDDEKLNMESSNIPEGGIRAVIYSKLLEMKNKKIKFDLETDFKIRKFNFDNTKDKNLLDICNILGVFLDNAIYASTDIGSKAYIKVTLKMHGSDLYISIKNKFKGTIDLNVIDNNGYTTKGNGHGYGLSLVKRILNENKYLSNIRNVSKNTFEQILIIKNKQN